MPRGGARPGAGRKPGELWGQNKNPGRKPLGDKRGKLVSFYLVPDLIPPAKALIAELKAKYKEKQAKAPR
jgi:hypothetical protein